MNIDYWEELGKKLRFVGFVMCGHLSINDANTLKEHITYVRVVHKNILRHNHDQLTFRDHLKDCFGWLI